MTLKLSSFLFMLKCLISTKKWRRNDGSSCTSSMTLTLFYDHAVMVCKFNIILGFSGKTWFSSSPGYKLIFQNFWGALPHPFGSNKLCENERQSKLQTFFTQRISLRKSIAALWIRYSFFEHKKKLFLFLSLSYCIRLE